MFPVYAHESFSHVSLPNSPGWGMVWNVHSRLPVRTSYPRMYPLVFSFDRGAVPPTIAAPITMTFRTTTAGDVELMTPSCGGG